MVGASIDVNILYLQILIYWQKMTASLAMPWVVRLFLDWRKLRFNFQVLHDMDKGKTKWTCWEVFTIFNIFGLSVIFWFVTDENEVAVISLDEPLADITDKEIRNFVSDVS